MKRLAALEALGRGVANVRGNIETVGVSAAGTIVLLGLVLLTLIPWLGLGPDELGSLVRVAMGQGQATDLPTIVRHSWALLSDFWGLVLALSVGLTLASVVYSWYFGGILGVLYAGDAQAPPGPGRAAELFRTWSARFFLGEATRLVWRVFWFFTLWLTIALGIVLLLVGGVVLGAAVGESAGGLGAVAVGCGVALPLLFVIFATVAAMSFGQVALVAEESGALAASKAGLSLLGRRLAAAIALLFLLFVAAFALVAVETGIGLAVTTALAGTPAAATAANIALFVVQTLVSSLLDLVFVAAFVALARSEQRLVADAAA